MGKYFGTDGIRGTVGKELTVDLALNPSFDNNTIIIS